MEKPYIISEELDIRKDESALFNADQLDTFRASVDADLRAMGKRTIWIPSSELRNGINNRLKRGSQPILSLDDIYTQSADQYLGISRGVTPDLKNGGYVARRGYPTIEQQFDNLSPLRGLVTVVDDVLFSGEMVEWLQYELNRRDIRIGRLVCGIALEEGLERMEKMRIPVDTEYIFGDVEDEICERDLAMVPGSGRRITTLEANALYVDPVYGKPAEWASIKEDQVDTFYENSLRRSFDLLDEETPMQAVGPFLGYGTTGTAREQIARRMEQQS